jgi:hypothetical protein
MIELAGDHGERPLVEDGEQLVVGEAQEGLEAAGGCQSG